MNYPKEIQNLIDVFAELPAVGPRTAERYVFYLLKQPKNVIDNFVFALNDFKGKLVKCEECMSISNTSPCPICSDSSRNKKQICIVENTQDMLVVENTNRYKGVYYVIGDKIDVADGYRDNLNTKRLLEKIQNDGIEEVIIALDLTLEGETTTKYLIKLLSKYKIKITRLARGLSMGSNLEYADPMTLINAFENRY